MEQLHSISLMFLLLPFVMPKRYSAVNYVNFVPNPFRKLSSVVLSSLEVSGPSKCAFECLDNQNCHSVNFGAVALDGRSHRCELLSGDMFREKANFIAHANFHHYNIESPCMTFPCRNGGTCFPIYDKDSYNCTCLPGYIGSHCETHLVTICEHERLEIRCRDGGKIQILSTNFGRLDNYTCPHDSHDYKTQTNYRAQTSLTRVKNKCQGKTSCGLRPTSEFFRVDPCYGIFKYLWVKSGYKCET